MIARFALWDDADSDVVTRPEATREGSIGMHRTGRGGPDRFENVSARQLGVDTRLYRADFRLLSK
jgi:hypothetical protein